MNDTLDPNVLSIRRATKAAHDANLHVYDRDSDSMVTGVMHESPKQPMRTKDAHVRLNMSRADLLTALAEFDKSASISKVKESITNALPRRPTIDDLTREIHRTSALLDQSTSATPIDAVSNANKLQALLRDQVRLRLGGWVSMVEEISNTSTQLHAHFESNQEDFDPALVKKLVSKMTVLNNTLNATIQPSEKTVFGKVIEKAKQILSGALDSLDAKVTRKPQPAPAPKSHGPR